MLGAILVGGKSRRMGSDKALVSVQGRPMITRVADALAVLDRVVAVGRNGTLEGIPCLPDVRRDVRGPLAGLLTALTAAEGPVVVVAVDQPFLRPETVAMLATVGSVDEAAVPIDGARQVTCARYPAKWLPEVTAEVEVGGSIQSLLDRLPFLPIEPEEWRSWGEDGRSWFSVDTPRALSQGLERFG